MAVLDGRVFRGTGDGRLIALDAATGKLLWKTVIGTPRLGEGASAAPLAWAGVVYMGISGSELGARGRVMAYDAQTGRELWRFNTIPMGKEIGADTWKRPKTAKTGGGGVWGCDDARRLERRVVRTASAIPGRTSIRLIAPEPTCSPTRSWCSMRAPAH